MADKKGVEKGGVLLKNKRCQEKCFVYVSVCNLLITMKKVDIPYI